MSWSFGTTPARGSYTTALAHSGVQSVRLGIPSGSANVRAFSTAYQRVTIPATGNQVVLAFWARAGGGTDGADYREVLLLTADYRRLRTIEKLTAGGDDRWQRRAFDLSAYAGQTVVVYFNVYNNGSGAQQWSYLDDVSLADCPQPVAAAALSPQPGPDAVAPIAADALFASPAAILLDDGASGRTATVAVQNLNPFGDTIGWQAATDVDWLIVTEPQGRTPDEFVVAATDQTRAAGVYAASLWLTPGQPDLAPVEVRVYLFWGVSERVFLPIVQR